MRIYFRIIGITMVFAALYKFINPKKSSVDIKKYDGKLKKGKKIGKWTLKKLLGQGGNGRVWSGIDDSGEKVALKFLYNLDRVRFGRFIHEIAVMELNSDIPGVVPILHKYINTNSSGDGSYYVMPIGEPVMEYIKTKPAKEIVKLIIDVSETLCDLHSRDISHRDIKPANLLVIDSRCYLSDFGLVNFPDKEKFTRTNEVIGPKGINPPEVLRNPSNSDWLKMDIYLLAKTLWMLLTKEVTGFEGQYIPNSDYGLEKYYPALYITRIEELLISCTDSDPLKRPNAREFTATLKDWLLILGDFEIKNIEQWKDIQNKVFPNMSPMKSIWQDLNDIIRVLRFTRRYDNMNHLFFPDGGGLDLVDVRTASEPGCIELDFGKIIAEKTIHIIKPKRLTFEVFRAHPEWNYFILETANLQPVDMRYFDGDDLDESRTIFEEVYEIKAGEYIPNYSIEEFLEKNPNHTMMKNYSVSRWIEGTFVIFGKNSPYNHIQATYDGRQNTMSVDEFRQHIEGLIEISDSLSEDINGLQDSIL